MRGRLAFLPARVTFFDDVIGALLAGRKINPDEFVTDATRLRRHLARARRWPLAIRALIEEARPADAAPGSTVWQRVRAQLDKLEYKPDVVVRRAKAAFDADLHLDGRPFFVTEGSAERVAAVVDAFLRAKSEDAVDGLARDQLARLDPTLPGAVEPGDPTVLEPDLAYRGDLLGGLKAIHDVAWFAREKREWRTSAGASRPAEEALVDEVPWRAAWLQSRSVPFWSARDVDGLETICRASGVPPPECLVPAWRLFSEACDVHPRLKEALRLEPARPRDLGAFVAPSDVGQLLEFLTLQGAKIIGAATRAGEGPAATALLRKIRECATYADRAGAGYLEVTGLVPPDLPQDAE